MRSHFKASVPALLLFVISCTKEPLQTPLAANTQTETTSLLQTAGHYIGEHYGGGVIFFLDTTRQHGLIADTVDVGLFTWYNRTYTVTGATSTRIGAGHKNTKKIILSQGSNGTYAALECVKSKRSDYTDWYMPSKDELYKMYRLKKIIGGFTDHIYWSSSEDYDHSAWYQDFLTGKPNTDFKSEAYRVRAIRSF